MHSPENQVPIAITPCCAACGAAVSDHARFCTGCGAELNGHKNAPAKEAPAPAYQPLVNRPEPSSVAAAPRGLEISDVRSGNRLAADITTATVGKSRGCDIVLTEDSVSRQHCRVSRTADGNIEVMDLGSANGTWIRLPKNAQILIQPGDVILVGHTPLRVE